MNQLLEIPNPILDKYQDLLNKYSKIDDSATLRKYKILKKIYLLGRELYGRRYTFNKMSDELDVPYTTVKRIMSLSKANKVTWQKIKDKKISVFRVAYILSTKDVTYQDEIIDMSIQNNLSTYDIKKMRIRDYKDCQKARLRVAVDRGFSRKHSALASFIYTVGRLDTLLDLNKEDLPEKQLPKLNKKLIHLREKINKFIS